jgi:hypothetical protein
MTAQLTMNHWSFPGLAKQRVTRKELREILLNTPEPVFVSGEGYKICHRHLGAGVYEVWLQRR